MIVDADGPASTSPAGRDQDPRYTRGSGKRQEDLLRRRRVPGRSPRRLHGGRPAAGILARTRQPRHPVNTNNIINTILPFDTKNAVKWNASYLADLVGEAQPRRQPAPRTGLGPVAVDRSRAGRGLGGRYDRGVRWEQEGLDVRGTRWCRCTCRWLYSTTSPAARRTAALHRGERSRTETMGSVPVQQWKLLLAALTVGTFLEAIAIWILAHLMSDDGGLACWPARPAPPACTGPSTGTTATPTSRTPSSGAPIRWELEPACSPVERNGVFLREAFPAPLLHRRRARQRGRNGCRRRA